MATAKGKTIKTAQFEIPVRDGRELKEELRRKLRAYERKYRISSAEMAARVRSDQVHETLEIFKWMSHYRVLESIESVTPTAGTPTTTTGFSTTST